MSGFEAKTATLRIPSNPKAGDSLDKDADLSFQEILDEEEAISRSVADQSKNMQNLAIRLTLKRLVSQFPGFEMPYLINLFIKSGLSQAKESLATLEKEIGDLRKSAKDMYDAKLSAKASSVHPGVLAFYNEEVCCILSKLTA
ncbi:unnamed protein product [Dibothriocephalus latus]|uniref:Uncharacterized protein n=1 Tax=Dibothriocephalus latus TaxID=60516 RepID=A0A3P7NES2_DIBLA|nr:unnamed protein product [Dibothriocephalus latus]